MDIKYNKKLMSQHKPESSCSEQQKAEEKLESINPIEQPNQPNSHQQQQIKQVEAEQIPIETIEIDPDAELEELIKDDPQQAQNLKQKATDYFKQENYNDAIIYYEQSIKHTPNQQLRSVLFSNIAICYIKNDEFSKANRFCKKALKYDESNKKARMNLGRCLEVAENYEEALEEFKKIKINEGKPLTQGDLKFIQEKINSLQKKVHQINEKRKQEVIGGLKNIGNNLLGYFGMSLDNFKLQQSENGGYNIQFKQ